MGSNLCERLLDEGNEVVCVDNLITGSCYNVEPLMSDPRFIFLQQDTCEPLPADLRADALYHLASPASPPGYFRHPLATALTNSLGTYRVLDFAQRQGARFLLASTSEVYGEPLEHPQREEYWGNVNPIGMRSCYDEGKRFAEALTFVYIREQGLDARVVRIFNTYGPRSDPDDGRLVPNFVTQALRGDPITVYGDGTQTRSLCYVSDLVEGLVRAMESPGTKGSVLNLGNPDEHTVMEYARLIKQLAGSHSPIRLVEPISEDEPTRRRPDITRAKRQLGWEPHVGLADGLTRTIDWFKGRIVADV